MNFQKLLFNGILSYHIRVGNESYFSGGLGGGVIEYAIDLGDLLFNSQFDGRIFNADLPSGEPINYENVWMGEVGGGLSYRWGRKINVGSGLFHGLCSKYGFIGEKKISLR